MILKYIFDRLVALIGLLFLWPVLLIVAILIKVKMRVDRLSSCRREWGRVANCLSVISSAR